MAQVINTNVSSLNAQRQLSRSQLGMQTAIADRHGERSEGG